MKQVCGDHSITGVSFSLHPMSDNFIDIILRAIESTDTSKVWIHTDDVTTTIRGKAVHVFDVSKAIFMHAAKTGEHVAFNATYSVGCPGDTDGDKYIAEDDHPNNLDEILGIKQPVAAKFSLYPLGGDDYMDMIYQQIEAMKEYVTVTRAHYSTRLDGKAISVFKGLENVFNATVREGANHIVMTVSISANSPSHKEDGEIEGGMGIS